MFKITLRTQSTAWMLGSPALRSRCGYKAGPPPPPAPWLWGFGSRRSVPQSCTHEGSFQHKEGPATMRITLGSKTLPLEQPRAAALAHGVSNL